jgi:hypothetical protein
MKLSPTGDSLWSRTYYARANTDNYLFDMAKTTDGGFVSTGYVFPEVAGETVDVWVLRLDSLGCVVSGCGAVGVDEVETAAPQLVVYPNPGNGQLTVNWTGIETPDKLKVVDLAGRVVCEIALRANNNVISLPELESGTYIMCVYWQDNILETQLYILE